MKIYIVKSKLSGETIEFTNLDKAFEYSISVNGEPSAECVENGVNLGSAKYRILYGETKEIDSVKLYRIELLRPLSTTGEAKGAKGGWVESYDNLSQVGDCWIGKEAAVYGRATVSENAVVTGRAVMRDTASASGRSLVKDRSVLSGDAAVSGSAIVAEDCCLGHGAKVRGGYLGRGVDVRNAEIGPYAFIDGQAWIERQSDFIQVCLPFGSVTAWRRALIGGISVHYDNKTFDGYDAFMRYVSEADASHAAILLATAALFRKVIPR